MKIGIGAAGSGGHVYPALAVAQELVSLGLAQTDIVFFGGTRMEAQIVPEAGFPFVAVDVHGIRRSLSVDNLKLPWKIRIATRVVADRIESDGIEAMVVFGGYISGPAGLAARRTKIPLIIHEANAIPGVANRMLAPLADTVYVAFEPAARRLRKGVVVGTPLRASIEMFDRRALRARAREHYGIDPDATVLGIFGGSLGASALNEIATEIAGSKERGFQILHLTGELHYPDMHVKAMRADSWIVIPFEAEMERFYAACDVVIARSGAITVSELHATATPSILVPLPAGRGYQGKNAADLVAVGGGVVIEQDQRSEIISTAEGLLGDEAERNKMSNAARASRHRGVAKTIASHVMEVAGE